MVAGPRTIRNIPMAAAAVTKAAMRARKCRDVMSVCSVLINVPDAGQVPPAGAVRDQPPAAPERVAVACRAGGKCLW